MARLNRPTNAEKSLRGRPDAITNHEGGLAFKTSLEMELYLTCCTAMFGEKKFYESASTERDRVLTILRNTSVSAEFILRLANYVRNRMYLRTIPLVMLCEVARRGDAPVGMVRTYTPRIVQRADEPAEVIAYWTSTFGSKHQFPNALKKGLSAAIARFDEYQLAKWDRNKATVKLRDVFRIVHPKPDSDERSALYKRVIDGEMATPETWETAISGGGSTSENWDNIVEKMPFMALLRNLRNFVGKDAKVAIEVAKRRLRDRDEVLRSKQLPFRFLSALRALTGQNRHRLSHIIGGNELMEAVAAAMDIAVENTPKFDGVTVVFSDNSGSMGNPISDKSTIQCIDIGGVMSAMALHCAEHSLVGVFGADYSDVHVSKADSVLTNAEKIRNKDVGHSTNAWLTIESLLQRNIVVDRVFLFSDMQCYESAGIWPCVGTPLPVLWRKYVSTIAPKARLYSFDLMGYGDSQFPQDDPSVVLLSGWSDKVFDFVDKIERGGSVLETINRDW